jgi:hypothetical protein
MSLLAIFTGRTRVIVFADSRGTGAGRKPIDDIDKLFRAGERTLVGTTGTVLNLGPSPTHYIPRWLGDQCANSAMQDKPLELLTLAGNEIHRLIEAVFKSDPARIPKSTWADEVIFGLFAIQRHRDGRVDLIEMSIQREGNTIGAPRITRHIDGEVPQPWGYWSGKCSFLERNHQSFNTDAPDEAVVRQAGQVVMTAGAEHGKTGGPVDIAAIEADGVRWLQKKVSKTTHAGVECPEDTRTITESDTMRPTDRYIEIDASAGPLTFTLLPFAEVRNELVLMRVDSSDHRITIECCPGDGIDDLALDAKTGREVSSANPLSGAGRYVVIPKPRVKEQLHA